MKFWDTDICVSQIQLPTAYEKLMLINRCQSHDIYAVAKDYCPI